MQYLKSNHREQLKGFAMSAEGEVVRNLVISVIDGLGDISTLDSDPVISRQKAIEYLKQNLLNPLKEVDMKEKPKVETYE